MQVRTAVLGSLMWMGGVGACGGNAQPAAQPPQPIANQAPPAPVAPRPAAPPPAAADDGSSKAAHTIAQMAAFRDDMCKCATKACADKIAEKMVEWAQRMAAGGAQSSQKLSEDETRHMTDITAAMTTCMTTAMTSGMPANGAATAGAPPDPSPPQNIAPTALDAQRIAGTKNIVPDDDVKRAFAGSGKSQMVTSYKLCVNIAGNVSTVSTLKSSGYASYDAKIQHELRAWKYRPFRVNGAPARVCTAVTFIYSQTEAPPPPARRP